MKNQTFGLEVEMNRISREKAARTIATVLGELCQYRTREIEVNSLHLIAVQLDFAIARKHTAPYSAHAVTACTGQ